MRDGRALIATDIGDTGLQQRFGYRQDTFTVKLLAVAETQQFHFLAE